MDFQAVLDFWFSLRNPGRKHDALVGETLAPAYRLAARGQLERWLEEPRSRLALLLLCDQVPRHIHREQPESFATDGKAQQCAALFFSRRDWEDFTPLELFFVAHPWLHAETLALQEQVNPFLRGVAAQLPGLEYMAGIAELYLETIRRFGRFPHRNAMLGRETSPEEEAFLKDEWYARRRRIRRDYGDCPGSRWLDSGG